MHYEKTTSREAYRNGYRKRSLKTRYGTLEPSQSPRAASTCKRYIHDLHNYQSFPEKHWRRIKTTNILERVNKELKRRSRAIGTFPNERSLIRLAVAILMDINEEW